MKRLYDPNKVFALQSRRQLERKVKRYRSLSWLMFVLGVITAIVFMKCI